MAARRLAMDHLQELVRLHRMGTNAREVARLLELSPNTERKYREALLSLGLLDGSPSSLPSPTDLKAAMASVLPPSAVPPQMRSGIEEYRDAISLLLDEGHTAKEIRRRLRERRPEFTGSYAQVKRMVQALKRARGVRAEDVAIPVHTDPGQVVQVDFGHIGKLYDPVSKTLRPAYVFVAVMGYSRFMWARIVFDQTVETWVSLHVALFGALGGVPRVAVPDNLKAAVIRCAFTASDVPTLNRSYRELARHYGFKIDPTPPYAPPKKGKVESGVKYLKNSVLKKREGEDVNDVQAALDDFLVAEANTRIHGSMQRIPAEQWSDERGTLLPLPTVRYDPVIWREAKVHRDCHVQFKRRLYSVPWKLVGQTVLVRATSSNVVVYADDERVATHTRRDEAGMSTDESHLPVGRSDLRHRSREHWEQRAEAMGEEVRDLVQEVFDSDDVLHQLRAVQAIVTMLESYPLARAQAAAKRAIFFGTLTYRGVKKILVDALDLQPLPIATVTTGTVSQPRFARSLEEIAMFGEEGGAHGPN